MAINLEKVPLHVARKIAGLTQKRLAEIVEVSESTVYKWERGTAEPTVSQAKKIGEACGISYDNIIFLPEDTV